MTTEIVKYDVNLDELQRMAKMLACSGYFDASQNETTAIAQMATKILAGRELGYGPFASVQGIHIIKGRPALSANLMAAAVKAHPRYDYRVRKMGNDEVTIEFLESGESIGVSTFTKADAIAAQTQNMSKFPKNMLFARAMSNGVRFYCPDVFYGNAVYTPEELGETVDGETGEIIAQAKVVKMVDKNAAPIIEKELPGTNPEGDYLFASPAKSVTNGNGQPKEITEFVKAMGTTVAVEESPYEPDAIEDLLNAVNRQVTGELKTWMLALQTDRENESMAQANEMHLSMLVNTINHSCGWEEADYGGIPYSDLLLLLLSGHAQYEDIDFIFARDLATKIVKQVTKPDGSVKVNSKWSSIDYENVLEVATILDKALKNEAQILA